MRFTKFLALFFRDFFKITGQNVTKHTLFELIFNLAPDDAIPAENNSLLTMVSAEITLPHVIFSGTKTWNGSFYCLQERPLMQSIKGRRLIVNLLDQSFCAHCVVI